MKYTAREGVILKNVVGEYLLLATGEAVKCCPSAMTLNRGAAFYWIMIEEGKTVDEMLEAAASVGNHTPDELRPGLLALLKNLESRNYILPEEEN